MSFNNDNTIDPDEALRMLDLLGGESGNDYVMMVEAKGKPLDGESKRIFQDGKARLDVGGYFYRTVVSAPPGSTKGVVNMDAFLVVRDSDAASASIASLMKTQVDDLKVSVSVLKAGGDSAGDEQPTLEYVLTDARVAHHVMLTGGRPRRPREFIVFGCRTVEIRSAPQTESGLRGAVRSCTISNA